VDLERALEVERIAKEAVLAADLLADKNEEAALALEEAESRCAAIDVKARDLYAMQTLERLFSAEKATAAAMKDSVWELEANPNPNPN